MTFLSDKEKHGGNVIGGRAAGKTWKALSEEEVTALSIEELFTLQSDDVVEKPNHYHQGAVECIEYIKGQLTEEQYKGYLTGSLYKYLHRFQYKNGEEDLRKARWFLEKLINDY